VLQFVSLESASKCFSSCHVFLGSAGTVRVMPLGRASVLEVQGMPALVSARACFSSRGTSTVV